jgi:hypothetical protein
MMIRPALHHVARLGGDGIASGLHPTYSRSQSPVLHWESGSIALPENIRNSKILTVIISDNSGTCMFYPAIDPSFEDDTLKNIFQYYSINPEEMEKELHVYARSYLQIEGVRGWQCLIGPN